MNTVEIEKLAAWSASKEVLTSNGRRLLRKASPTEAFSAAWKASKAMPDHPLKSAGVSWSKDKRTGNWECCWWQPVSAGQAAQENKAIEASKAIDADVAIPVPDGLAYMPFQKAGISFAAGRPGTLIGDEMGLGKTIQAIGIINMDPTVKRVLVMCPASLKLNWSREIAKWAVRPLRVGVQLAKEAWIGDVCDVVVMNYDIAGKFEKAITATVWDLFICDECHHLKNPKAARTKIVLGKKARGQEPGHDGVKARRRVFMSGTPLINRPIELFPLLRSLEPGKWGFKDQIRYCAGFQNGWGWDFSGASHLDELHNRLRSTVMVRRLKKDVLKDLPPKRRQIIEIAANGSAGLVREEAEAFAAHEARLTTLKAKVAAAAMADDQTGYAALADQLKKAYSVAFEEIAKQRHAVAVAKIPAVIEHLRLAMDEGKVVCFAHHRDVVDALQAEFGAAAVHLYGGMTEADKDAAVRAFQEDPTVTLFIGSITAAGVGITLTASSHVVMAELDWRPGIVSQAEDRTHRIGQADAVLVQHLVLEGSLDAKMVKTIVRKQDVADRVLDKGAAMVVGAEPVLAVELGSVLDNSDAAACGDALPVSGTSDGAGVRGENATTGLATLEIETSRMRRCRICAR